MTRRVLTDAERIVSIREVIEAARGDWHEATALWSIGADLNWLLDVAARSLTTPEAAGLRRAAAETVKVLDIMLERQTLTGAATARDWLRAALAEKQP